MSKLYEEVINTFIDSKDMREHLLSTFDNRPWYCDLVKIVIQSPKSVQVKLEMLKRLKSTGFDHPDDLLSEYDINNYVEYINDSIKYYEKGYDLLHTKGIFILNFEWYLSNGVQSTTETVSDNFDTIMTYINKNDEDYTDSCIPHYYNIDKWDVDDNGEYTNVSSYIIKDGEIVYMYLANELKSSFPSCGDMGRECIGDMALSAPFDKGDIIRVKGYGYTPDNYIIILHNKKNGDCCALQGIAQNQYHNYTFGGVCHAHMGYSDYTLLVPYLFSAELISQDDIDDSLLKELSKILKKTDDPDKPIHIEDSLYLLENLYDTSRYYGINIALLKLAFDCEFDIDRIKDVIKTCGIGDKSKK